MYDDSELHAGDLVSVTMFVTADSYYVELGIYDVAADEQLSSAWYEGKAPKQAAPLNNYGCDSWGDERNEAPATHPLMMYDDGTTWQERNKAYFKPYFGVQACDDHYTGTSGDYKVATPVDLSYCLTGSWSGIVTGGGPWTYSGGGIDVTLSAFNNTNSCGFVLEITCSATGDIIWIGQRTDCGSPEGVYQRTGGTSFTGDVTVEYPY
jgi:hypothetical protein